jgi:hypothetical protein
VRSIKRDYADFIPELSAFLVHYKAATGDSNKAIAQAAGLARAAVDKPRHGKEAPNLRSFYRTLVATGKSDISLDGVVNIKLRAVNARHRQSP